MGLFGSNSESGVLGSIGGALFGGKSGSEKTLESLSKAYYGGSLLQRMLPQALRAGQTDKILGAGVQGIGNLIMNPGGLSPNVSDAIRPQQAMESQSIQQNFRNMQQQNAGNAARGNAPISIKNALSSALDTQQERSMRQSRMESLMQSGLLQRQDAEQVYKLLDTILQFMSSGRGQGVQGLAAASGIGLQRQNMDKQSAMDFMSMIAGAGGGGIGMGG